MVRPAKSKVSPVHKNRLNRDQIEALAPEREALWTRLEKTSFLTDDEKRSAAGYGPKPLTKFNPHHDPSNGQFTSGPGGGGSLIPVAGKPTVPKPPPKPNVPAPATKPGPVTVPPGKTLRNEALAGKNHPVTGIPFDKQGFPDFSGVAQKSVSVPHTGNYDKDFVAANASAGLTSLPKGMTWHHHQDGVTMQLVPQDVHSKTGHTGSIGIGNLPGKK